MKIKQKIKLDELKLTQRKADMEATKEKMATMMEAMISMQK